MPKAKASAGSARADPASHGRRLGPDSATIRPLAFPSGRKAAIYRYWVAQGLPARNYAAAFFGMSGQLLKGVRYFVDVRYDQTFETFERLVSPPGLRLTFRLMKTFNWGEPVKPAGFRSGFSDGRNGSISGSVFNDDNGNGVMDPGEKGLPRFSLKLEDGSAVETGDGWIVPLLPRRGRRAYRRLWTSAIFRSRYNILGPAEQRIAVAFRSGTH